MKEQSLFIKNSFVTDRTSFIVNGVERVVVVITTDLLVLSSKKKNQIQLIINLSILDKLFLIEVLGYIFEYDAKMYYM